MDTYERLQAALEVIRFKRAWCRGKLFVTRIEMIHEFPRCDGIPVPHLQWYRKDQDGNAWEKRPWTGSLGRDIDRTQYEDRLLKGLSWRLPGFRRHRGNNGSYNAKVWLGEWPAHQPPAVRYLIHRKILPDGTLAQSKSVANLYRSHFIKMVELFKLHGHLGKLAKSMIATYDGMIDLEDACQNACALRPPVMPKA
jgi:hypothetical protein